MNVREPTKPENKVRALLQAALIMEDECQGKRTGNFLYTDTIARLLREEANKIEVNELNK